MNETRAHVTYQVNPCISHGFCRLLQLPELLDDLNANDLKCLWMHWLNAFHTPAGCVDITGIHIRDQNTCWELLNSTLPTQSPLIYSSPLIVLVFSIKKTKMFPKHTPFILQQPRIDVVLAGSVTPSQPRTKNLFVLLHFKEFLIQSIKAVLQISHGSTPSAAWSIFILLIRPLPSHFVISKFILYRIFLWKPCHKYMLLHLLMCIGGRGMKMERTLVKIKFVSAVSRTV